MTVTPETALTLLPLYLLAIIIAASALRHEKRSEP
jgi:hypothetical protein